MNIASHKHTKTIEVESKTHSQYIRDAKIIEELQKGYDLSVWLNRYKGELEAIKKSIADFAMKWAPEEGTVKLITPPVMCTLNIRCDSYISSEDAGKLHEILGDRFDDLVFTKTHHKPARKLILLADGNDEIAELISFKERSPSLKFEKV